MPKETIVRAEKTTVDLTWTAGVEARLEVNLNGFKLPDGSGLVHHESLLLKAEDIDRLVKVLRRAKNQVFNMTLMQAMLKPESMDRLLKSFIPSSTYTFLPKARIVDCQFPTVVDPDVPDFSAGFFCLREKKTLEPTTLHYARQVSPRNYGSNAVSALAFEKAFARELAGLSTRFDNFTELVLMDALFDTLKKPDSSGNPFVEVNVNFDPSQKLDFSGRYLGNVGIGWKYPTVDLDTIVQEVEEVKCRYGVANDGLLPTHAYCSAKVVETIFSKSGDLSAPWKDSYRETGRLSGFCDMYWEVPGPMLSCSGQPVGPPAGTIAVVNWDGDPLHLVHGPCMDDSAPAMHTGRFAKGWQEQDPSAPQILLEDSIFPLLAKPKQVLTVKVF